MPTWFRATVLTVLLLALLGVIVLDFESRDFEAQATALALIGVIGTMSAGGSRSSGGEA